MRFESPEVIVLGAGGILGEAWMGGLLAGLKEASGFDPRSCDHFVGTSAGSIVAAGLAGGVDPASRLERLPHQPEVAPAAATPRSLLGGALRFGREAGATAFAPLAALALSATSMSGAAVRRAALARVPAGKRSLAGLGSAIGELRLDWDGRLLVVTVEVESGTRVVFGTPGETHLSVPAAVEASCAIPGVFRPVRANGRTYVDGGAWSLTNLDVAPVARGTHVLCLNPTGSLGPTTSLRGAIGPLSRSAAAVEALALQRRGAHVTTLSPDGDAARAMGSDFMDGRHRSAAQQAGYAQGLRAARQLAHAA
ncbi:MAG TPA: patatin-like phospholipase family protein [Thermoleophilaceae bacterium]